MIPILRDLTTEEASALEAALDLAAQLSKSQRPMTMSQVQALYDKLLAKWWRDKRSVNALGLTFGSHFVADGYSWARALYSDGEETVLVAETPTGQSISSPVSIIQKRLHQRERVDLAKLRSAIVASRNHI